MKKVFCVEDDANIRELLEYTLGVSGFQAAGFGNASDFMDCIEKDKPDIILLDIMLPDTDGMEILETLRNNSETQKIPVIMLTAKSGRLDKIKGLDCGADDYITKPFDVLELVSRINAVLRRTATDDNADKSAVIEYNDIVVNTKSRTVTVNGQAIVLTFKEFELLHHLIVNKGIVLTREKLMNDVWGTGFEGETRTVDVHIRTLRQKLGSAGEYILTVRNVGYRVTDNV